ncbi:MAG: penicillin-binding protein 2 [Campylobacteraceae bacterium]|nr:penicillin-binding protein 2 [Campylobacteraceae bacterium]
MRFKIALFFILSVWLVLIGRVYFLSVKSSDFYEEVALQNAYKSRDIAPTRGQIFDSKKNPVAINHLGYSISLKPHLKEEIVIAETEALESLFYDLNATLLQREYKKQNSAYNQEFIKVVDFLEYDLVVPHFSKLNLNPNLEVLPSSLRHYPYGKLGSHIIGYVGRANTRDIEINPLSKLTNVMGRSGIEAYYNDILQGEKGERTTKVTALNQVVEEVSYTKPTSKDIELHIDMELQEYLRNLYDDKAGAVVVMDVYTGAIIGAGSYPEFDPNPFVTGISSAEWKELIEDLDYPFTNKMVNGLYPPGSVIKMSMSMAFLNSGRISRDKTYFCNGAMQLGNHSFRCWKRWGHGTVSMNQAIRESCDVYYYEGSLEVGIDFLSASLERHGFGRKTGIDLPNEFVGTVPSKAWKMEKYGKPWYMGETVNTSIGQGSFLVTPIQVVKNTAEIASGKGLTPHFLKSIDGEEVEFQTYEIFTPFEKEQLPYIRKAMYEVANHQNGTAYQHLKDSSVKIAAKTGTAQVVGIPQNVIVRMKEKDMEYYHRSHAWIVGYAPYKNPKYAAVVLVEHGGGGSSIGGPILRQIFEKLVEMEYIDLNATK